MTSVPDTRAGVLVLGGTAEGRAVAEALVAAGHDVLLSVVTEYAAELAARGDPGALSPPPLEDASSPDRPAASLDRADRPDRMARSAVRHGPLGEDGLDEAIAAAIAVVDATHPFATRITRDARSACARARTPYLRMERPPLEHLDAEAMTAPDAASAAALAMATGGDGAVFLTVGTRTLATYAQAARSAGRPIVARVLPTEESLHACRNAGLAPSEVIAMQGPTSAALDEALMTHFGASVLVTKDSGAAGGVQEKLAAARRCGAAAVVVARPPQGRDEATEDTVHDIAAVVRWVDDIRAGGASRTDAVPHLKHGLLQVYTGAGKGKSTASVGLALRARGRGLTVAFVQFVKGGPESGELEPLRAAGVEVVRPASARTGLLRGGAATDEDRRAATAAWNAARGRIAAGCTDLVILDELHAALRRGLVDLGEAVAVIEARPAHVEVVTTGRSAPQQLCGIADLVTEMKPRKHPYPAVKARRGIEL